MVKVNVEIPMEDWHTIKAIAEKLAMKPEDLIQQSVDQDLADMSVWLQRAEMLT